jgi:hypothetical protein
MVKEFFGMCVYGNRFFCLLLLLGCLLYRRSVSNLTPLKTAFDAVICHCPLCVCVRACVCAWDTLVNNGL